MPSDVTDLHAWKHLSVAVEELDQVVAVGERREIVGDIARPAAHVGLQREVPLAPLDEMARLLESELDLAVLIASRESPCVVPVQVRGDDRIDLVRRDAEAAQGVQHALRLAQRNLPRALLAELGSDAGFADDDAPVFARD